MKELLRVEKLNKYFKKKSNAFHAVSDIDFSIEKGEILGLIGESGSGKSTIAKIIAGIEVSYEGTIYYKEKILSKSMKERATMQMIFQNPATSLNPKQKIRKSLTDSLQYSNNYKKEELEKELTEAINQVKLPLDYLDKYPSQLSGGECQRVCIAKSILRKPDLLICDEATSALDVSVQKEILELLKSIQEKYKMSILFISHDIAVVNELCSRVLVLKEGKIIEELHKGQDYAACENEYVKELFNAVIRLEDIK